MRIFYRRDNMTNLLNWQAKATKRACFISFGIWKCYPPPEKGHYLYKDTWNLIIIYKWHENITSCHQKFNIYPRGINGCLINVFSMSSLIPLQRVAINTEQSKKTKGETFIIPFISKSASIIWNSSFSISSHYWCYWWLASEQAIWRSAHQIYYSLLRSMLL